MLCNICPDNLSVNGYIITADGITVLDYGDGTCDKVATKTSPDGTVTEVELGRKRHH